MGIITTVIPVFNGEKYIAQTLDSLARQTRKADRVIIVDDCSTDRTEEIVRNFAGLNCEWMHNPKNLGLFGNHNSALRFAAETRFFHILHANDLVAPTFFEKLVPLIENSSGFAMAYCGHQFIREDGSATNQKSCISGSVPRRIGLGNFLASQTELKAVQLHSVVMRTDNQPSPIEFRLDLPQLGDVVFHAQFAAHCKGIWVHPDIMSLVRIHTDSATSRNISKLNSWVLDEWKAMQLVYEIMKDSGVAGWGRASKLRLLFAARCHVKIESIIATHPAYAREIRAAVDPLTGQGTWIAARAIVALRNKFFPKPNQMSDRLSQKKS